MALSEDSRALLQLLLGKGQSYADISDILGASEDEVRSRARSALTELGDRDPDTNAPLTDYLLGQADPITRADVARHLADDPEDQELADTLSAKLKLLAPSASMPKQNRPGISPARKSSRSGGKKGGSEGGRSGRKPRTKSQGPELSIQQRRLIALLLGAALLIVVIILLVTGAFKGSEDGGANPEPTTATLTAVQGQTGSGTAEFGFSGANLATNLELNDLEPSAKDESYTTWITGPKGIAYPINQGPAGEDGKIVGQVAINQAIICFIAADAFTDLKVSRVTDAEMEATLTAAGQANKGKGDFPEYVGDTVMTGPIVMPAEAKKQVLPSCSGANTSSSATGQ